MAVQRPHLSDGMEQRYDVCEGLVRVEQDRYRVAILQQCLSRMR
jgi:hypothetical protein